MQTKEAIKFALTVANGAVLSTIDQISDAPTTFPTANGGCHPLWVLGHLALVEGTIPQLLLGEENPVAHWERYFGAGTEPTADASQYPPLAEIRSKYQQLREKNLKFLDTLTDEDMDHPTKAQPPGLEHEFATYGTSLMTLALHQMLHRSHLTDAQRSAGRLQTKAEAA